MTDDVSGNATVDAYVGGRRMQYALKDLPSFASIETYAGTSVILRRSHARGVIGTTSSSPVAIVVPPSAAVAFVAGTQISVVQMGSGQVTFVAGSGVTIRTPETLKLAKQYAVATIILVGTDEWLLAGYLEAA